MVEVKSTRRHGDDFSGQQTEYTIEEIQKLVAEQYGKRAARAELASWRENLTERERSLLSICQVYVDEGSKAGLPGHALMLLVVKLAGLLDAKA